MVTISYRADLQGLRAVAITLVVLAHAGVPGLAGGFVGVDAFFVLSGYLITALLLSEALEKGRIDYLAFIARRLRRLLPALITMLTVAMLLGVLLLSSHELTEQSASVAYAASWTSNLFFAFSVFDYFADLHLRDLFLHTWSLGVEEQFYLFWPFLVTLLLAGAKLSGRAASRRVLLAGLGAVFAVSLVLSLYWSYTPSLSLWAFYLMPSRIWQFTLGALVYVALEMSNRQGASGMTGRNATVWPGLGLAGIALILGSAVLLRPSNTYPGLMALLPSAGAALVIAEGTGGQRGAASLLSHPALVWIGDRSYSWYLWHWPFLMLGFAWGLKNDPAATGALVLLSLIAAMGSYRLIELPFWKGRFRSLKPGRSIALSLAVISASAIALHQLSLSYRDNADRGAELARKASNDMPAVYSVPGCDTWDKDAVFKPCVMQNGQAEKTVAIIGDSIGMQWYSLLPALFSGPDWRIVALTKSSCAIVDATLSYGGDGGSFKACTDWRNQVLKDIADLDPEIIFVGSSAHHRIKKEQWIAGTRRVLDRFTKVATQVFVIPGTPQLSFNGPGCLERWLTHHGYEEKPDNSACRELRRDDHARQVELYLAEAVSAYANAHLLALNDLVCPDWLCGARSDDGLVVFRDQQHLTDSFVRTRSGVVKQRLEQLGLSFSTND